ncbi:response regulator [Pseudomonas sp. MWU13-2105]|uniref:response regulator n=1 Tax=Pseudomonas sp. MWU13-2105 TaxID=2935074 RepID=UPI00201049A4|nr:response regulator [Pseudomonas sp. MWU13-2105]
MDDQPAHRFILNEQLKILGIRAVVVSSGAQALQVIEQQPIRLLLLDCYMPEINGYEVARRIRARERGPEYLPIIALSVQSGPAHQKRCMDSGMDGVLKKPLYLDALRNLLQLWLDHEPSPAARPVPHYDAAMLQSLYREALEKDLATLQGAVSRADFAEASHRAHRIKGAGLMMGAQAIAETAKVLEQAIGARAGELTMRDAVAQLQQSIEDWYR